VVERLGMILTSCIFEYTCLSKGRVNVTSPEVQLGMASLMELNVNRKRERVTCFYSYALPIQRKGEWSYKQHWIIIHQSGKKCRNLPSYISQCVNGFTIVMLRKRLTRQDPLSPRC
jgi:hypothetical protein